MDRVITLGDILSASLGAIGILGLLGLCLFILSVIASGYKH